MKYSSLLIFGLCVMVTACGDNENVSKDMDWDNEKSMTMNRQLAEEEEVNIRIFLASRKNWKTVKTGSGLRYYIYEKGMGDKAQSGMEAEVKFKIQLLDGTLCYQTDTLETETFEIDHSEVETGIQEGIKKMAVGDKAKLIIPSHLAHGISGNSDKIPPLNPLVVDLQLISLKK